MRLRTLLIPPLLAAIALPAAAAQRQHDSHRHGGGRLDVAVDGGRLSIALEMPAINLVGFEHAPRTAAQRAGIERAVRQLEDGAALFRPSPAARCAQVAVEITSSLVQDLEAEQDSDHGDDHGDAERDHADFAVAWEFECDRPAALDGLAPTLFERFPGTGHLRLQWISAGGQGGGRIDADRPGVELKPR